LRTAISLAIRCESHVQGAAISISESLPATHIGRWVFQLHRTKADSPASTSGPFAKTVREDRSRVAHMTRCEDDF
jgi:hypothetical protein